jgi:ABC-type nitrate/sulfonate/bicarbonate transport system substrate-binding protein
VPLVDCALLAVAQEKGLFARQNLDVELRKAQSWVQVQDKLLGGEWDAAHCLITMPLQFAMAAPAGDAPVGYAFTLSRNGNGLILSNLLWNDGVREPAGLSAWLGAHPGRILRLGVVFQRGTQEYFLRSWLARGGLSLGDRIQLTVIPPQEMVGRLRKNEIDGFCAGEPWSRRASASKLGRLVADSGSLLPGLGEKVLGVRTAWHRSHSLAHSRLIRALSHASSWLADPANRSEAVEIIASKHYVNTPKTVVEGALKDAADRGLPTGSAVGARFSGGGTDAPMQSHARWYLEQMARWGHMNVTASPEADLSSICMEGFYQSVTGPIASRPPSPMVGSSTGAPIKPGLAALS